MILLIQFTGITGAFAQIPQLSPQQLDWLGHRIFANECASRLPCLTSWNPGEDFPSLGIGHFIWYQSGQEEVFEETFPALLDYYRDKNVAIPQWLQSTPDSPWQDRNQFLEDIDSPRMEQLRHFLADTMQVQVRFISERLYDTLDQLVYELPEAERKQIKASVDAIANSSPPLGLYALIDYVHFKGTGLMLSESYQGHGWGLRQVLEQMQNSEPKLENFVAAAEFVLARRVANAPPERNEERWLQGWNNRLQTYLPAAQH